MVRSLQGLQRWGSHWRRSTSARCRYEERWLESLERLERELNLPWGMLRIKTPSGGLHIYLKAPEDFEVRQRVNNLSGFPGIAVTHCVASVGSSINGKQYEVLTPPESYRGGEAAPDEIIDLCRQAATKIRKTIATPVVPLDREHAIKRAIDGLSRHPIVREFEESDRKIYNLAIKLRTFGISENTCWQLICKYLSEAGRTEPQFDPEWIEQKVRNFSPILKAERAELCLGKGSCSDPISAT